MAIKLIILAAFVATTSAGVLTPVAQAVVDGEYDPNPHYTFGYDVQDPFTGDYKNQIESRSGDVVHGSYSLNDPDGTRRVVEYTADPINGFNAIVKKSPILQTLLTSSIVANNVDTTPLKEQFKKTLPTFTSAVPYSLHYTPFLYTYPTLYNSPYIAHYY